MIGRLRQMIKMISDSKYRQDFYEMERLSKLSRYQSTTTPFLGRPLHIVDSATFMSGVDEIFKGCIYEFQAATRSPVIIDCGANIGLSIIYFKQLYPNSQIIGFEADPTIFSVLQKNISAFDFTKVDIQNKAVWNAAKTITFQVEGGFSGRVAKYGDEVNTIEVETIRLRDLLTTKIDFLKIDIEGAETEVLRDCASKLGMVENMFVEYHSHSSEAQSLHELLSILHQAKFRYHIKEAYTVPKPFIDRPLMVGMDLQLNIFAFRD